MRKKKKKKNSLNHFEKKKKERKKSQGIALIDFSEDEDNVLIKGKLIIILP